MSDTTRGNVWIFVEQHAGEIADVSLELVCRGRGLADALGVHTEAILMGDGVGDLASVLHTYGCDNVFVADDPELHYFRALPYAKVIGSLIAEHNPEIVLFGATHVGRSLAPRVASARRAGLTADCTDLQLGDFEDRVEKRLLTDRLMQIRPAFGGNIIATIATSWEGPQMVTVREGVMKMNPPEPNRTGTVTQVSVALEPGDLLLEILEQVREPSSTNLKGSQIIVSGGYGVGSKEGFDLICRLADTLGAAVGASRAAVDAGWVDHDHQVGQTGVTVRPRLYIACGISGSVQHRAGMAESAKIVAINTDSDAPIFAIAHYSVVGDLHQVIPAFIKAYKERV